MNNPPPWLQDNQALQQLLHRFINKCEKPHTVQFQESVSAKLIPELFDYANAESEYLWSLIDLELHQKHKIIDHIKYRKVALHAEKYEKAILYFNANSEDLVRGWLQRPHRLPYPLQWREALNEHPHFARTLLQHPLDIKGLTAAEIIAGFMRAYDELNRLDKASTKISLRGLSARCFWGDSKFLEQRRELIESIFDAAYRVIIPRARMLSAYVPPQLRELIFVENFDSFLSTVQAIKNTPKKEFTAIVYSSGYLGSASTIREQGHSQFVTINSVDKSVLEAFQRWWFSADDTVIKTNNDEKNNTETNAVKSYFWGDFDYEGMRILKALRKNFPTTTAWKIGYDLILKYHAQGLGHSPELAGKELQKNPECCNCEYADHTLIPKLIKSQRFIDQEVVSETQLIEALSCTD